MVLDRDEGEAIRCGKFLELVNCHSHRLPELIEANEGHLVSGFSMEDLLPSVEFVRSAIRFVLYRTLGIGAETRLDDQTCRMYRGSCELHFKNLEALVHPLWKERLPQYIRRDFSVIAKTARDAASLFLHVYRSPKHRWPPMATCRWCQGYFVMEHEEAGFCSEQCRKRHERIAKS